MSTCSRCASNPAQGGHYATSRTAQIASGATLELEAQNLLRRTALVVNQSAGRLVVGFGDATVVDGSGTGIDLAPGQSLSVATTAAVHVLNPQAATAQVGYVTEQD